MQSSLFGEPELKPALSQWHTPAWLARKLASWVPRGARILEPSCGGGALIEGLLRTGHQAVNLAACELDPSWAAHCKERFPNVTVLVGDFLDPVLHPFVCDQFDVAVMNPPFEDNCHLRFVLRALELAPVVVGVFPASFEFSAERDRELWSRRGVVTRRARMPLRVDYGGQSNGMFDSVALRIERRECPRIAGSIREVLEEVWLP